MVNTDDSKQGAPASEAGVAVAQHLPEGAVEVGPALQIVNPPSNNKIDPENTPTSEHPDSLAPIGQTSIRDEEGPSPNYFNEMTDSPLVAFLPRESANADLRDSATSSKQFQSWVDFSKHHREVLDTRVWAKERYNAFNEKLTKLRDANNSLARAVSAMQARPSDARLRDRLLKESFTVRYAQEQLDAEGEHLQKIQSELVQKEWELFNLLPKILQNDNEAEDMSSSVRKQGIEFRGEDSYAQGSTAEIWEPTTEPGLDPETQLIESKLDAIRTLEDEILSLRDDRARLMQRTLLLAGESSEAREKKYDEIDRYDARESTLTADLRLALVNLEGLRKLEETDVVLVAKPAEAEHEGEHAGLEADKEEQRIRSSGNIDRAEFSKLFAALRRLLHSESMKQLGVFPESMIETSHERADPLDLINSWLFHQIRSSDDELQRYIDCLLRRVRFSRALSPEQILEHALREWDRDITLKAPWNAHNTTNQTLLGGSRFLFSNTASLSYPFVRAPAFAEFTPTPFVKPREKRLSPLQDQSQYEND